MKRLIAAVLFCLVVLVVAADGLDAGCRDLDGSQPCCACLCVNPASVSGDSGKQAVIRVVTRQVLPAGSQIRQRLFDKSVFHPPIPSV